MAASSGAWRALCLYRSGAGASEVVEAARSEAGGDAQRAVLAAVADAAYAGRPPAPGAARRVLRAALLAAEAAGEEASPSFATVIDVPFAHVRLSCAGQ
jgi:hypothetical protein